MKITEKKYDIVVVGGGHAGCEAALASARLGMKTALVTFRRDTIAEMSCNPSIGGLAKGHIVREIDALGGEMAKAIDATGIQFRILNRSKGPAVQAPRAQADREKYKEYFVNLLERTENLELIYGEAARIKVESGRIVGLALADGSDLKTEKVIITTGTFLRGLIHIGEKRFNAGRIGEPPAEYLSESLKKAGLKLGRLKTGTPSRLYRDSIDFSKTEAQPGDEPPHPFSFDSQKPELEQVPCWLTFTNEKTHSVIQKNLDRSPLYSGVIVGIGPRYCPSIEDKVVKFPERKRHQVFLEPDGRDSNIIYPSGISSSLPADVQEDFIRTIPGLENARIAKHGYAIEYDFVFPAQLRSSLETKSIRGLYLAGQINGTSGYEEAAAQGLIAGINAARSVRDEEPLILSRDQAYIGVLIDDLITQDVDEPYRMFTARAEYRLLLRCDNADRRLMPLGAKIGLVSSERLNSMNEKYSQIERLKSLLKSKIITDTMLSDDERRQFFGEKQASGGITLFQLLKRPENKIDFLVKRYYSELCSEFSPQIFDLAEIEIKYDGYIQLQEKAAKKAHQIEDRVIPQDFDYKHVPGLSKEAQERLNRFRPENLGKAARMQGITPSAVAALAVALGKRTNGKRKRRT